jgi:adenosylcobinamide-GDP ribazoletransferase
MAPGWPDAAALAVAAVTGRTAVVLATGPGSPAARPDGFGALVAEATSARARVTAGTALVAVAAVTAAAVWGWYPAVRGVVAVLAGLCAGDLLRRLARRRLGGMTGDVFGAVIEVSSAVVLLALALTA